MSQSQPVAIDTYVLLETPENVVFAQTIAGPATRAVAHLVDWVCIGFLLFIAAVVAAGFAIGSALAGVGEELAGISIGFLLLALFAAQWVYFAAFEAWMGCTPGKKLLGLRVVTTSGRPIDTRQAITRNLLRVADLLPGWYAIGVIAMTASPRFQRLGDWAAGTMVVTRAASRRANAIVVSPRVTMAERSALPPHLQLTPLERDAVEILIRRAPWLGAARHGELARLLAEPIGARLGTHFTTPARQLEVLYERALEAGRPTGAAAGATTPRGAS